MMRPLLVASLFACALLVPGTTDAAGAVLPLADSPVPAFVDVRMAVAVSPSGSTRWSEITVPSGTPAMWLVPVRPGAVVDWAPRRWLDALDDATAPRVLPPNVSSACPLPVNAPEKAAPWTPARPGPVGGPVSVQPTADAARAHVAERGHRLSSAVDTKITELYARGWNLVAVELPAGAAAQASATLRVSDDGGDGRNVLPLALAGGASTRVTVFAIGAGVARVPGTRDIDTSELRWGREGSTYDEWRSAIVRGGRGDIWLRESASHTAIFDETPVVRGAHPIASVVTGYLPDPPCSPAAAQALSAHQGAVAVSCGPGAAARVPGSAGCIPSSSGIDPTVLRCSSDIDLALALAGLAPARAVVTRLAGWIPAGTQGSDLEVQFDPGASHQLPLIHAGEDDHCTAPPASEGLSPVPPPQPPISSSSSSGGDEYVPASDGCGGSTVVTGGGTTYDEPAPEDDGSSSESCSGDGSSSGWDDSDDSGGWDDSDSGDSCSSDESSSSSDSCSGGSSSSSSSSSGGSDDGWDSEDSDDGWDTADDMSPENKKLRPASKKPKPHAKTTKKKSSPVSRYALLAAALLLPLRRRKRRVGDAEADRTRF